MPHLVNIFDTFAIRNHHLLATEIIIKPKSAFSFGLEELWQYRELLYFFTWKEIKVRYKQAALGIIWTVLQPLISMAVFVILLSKGLGISTGSLPPPLYYLSGLLIWNLFSHSVTNAAQSMVSNANIIKKIYFPRIIIPISSVLTASFDFLISIVLFIGCAIYYELSNEIEISWAHFIVGMISAYFITIITSFSLGTLLAAFNVKYRDVRYALPFFIQTLFFVTPVIYDASKISTGWAKTILTINPLSYAIELLRKNLLGQDNIFLTEYFFPVLIFILLMYVVAIYTFRKTEAYFADIV